MCHDECSACKGAGGHFTGGKVGNKFIICKTCNGAGYMSIDATVPCPYLPGSKQKVAALRARWESKKRLWWRNDFRDKEADHGVILKGMVAR